MSNFYSETMLNLNRKEHIEAIKEALLFCCKAEGSDEEKIASAVKALRTCARWYPTTGE